MFNLTLKEKIQSALRRSHRPSSAARERCKTVFLSAVRTSFPPASPFAEGTMPKFRYFARGFVTALAIVALVGSVTTYADYADVSAESALYPLKRTSESVRLSLANEEKKPELHLELANRRLKEMKTAKETARAERLANDFTNEIRQSIVITVSVPATVSSPTPPEIQIAAPTTVRALRIEYSGEDTSGLDDDKDENGDSEINDSGRDLKSKKEEGRNSESKRARFMARSDDPFCEQLEEMISDPNPAIQAITANDPVLRTLLSERCEFKSMWGTQLASTSLPTIP